MSRGSSSVRRAFVGVLAAFVVLAGCAGDDDDAAPPATDVVDAPDDIAPDDTAPETDETAADVELSEDAWVELAEAPLALTENDAAAFEGELWVVGGFTADAGVTTSVSIYHPASDTWRSGPELPEPVHHARLVATDDTLVLIGGYRAVTFEPIDEVLVLDADATGWEVGPALPSPRGAGGGAWDGERIVFGGGVGPDGLADDVWALDGPGGEWSELGRLSVARDHLDAASDGDGAVWFLAGRELSLDANLAVVDLVVGDEVRLLGELPTPRGGVAAFYSAAHGACAAGGEAPTATFDEVECIDADGVVSSLPALGVGRHGLGADVIDGVAYVALGGPDPMLAVSAVIEALRLEG